MMNPLPPMKGRMVKIKGRKQAVVNAYRNAQTAQIHIKVGRVWYTRGDKNGQN